MPLNETLVEATANPLSICGTGPQYTSWQRGMYDWDQVPPGWHFVRISVTPVAKVCKRSKRKQMLNFDLTHAYSLVDIIIIHQYYRVAHCLFMYSQITYVNRVAYKIHILSYSRYFL